MDDLRLMYEVVNLWLDEHNDYHQTKRSKIGKGLRLDLRDILSGTYCGACGVQEER